MKPFLTQLQGWLEATNFDELDKCEWAVAQRLRQWGRVVSQMETDPACELNKKSWAIALRSEYNQLRKLVKRIDRLYKDRSKLDSEGLVPSKDQP